MYKTRSYNLKTRLCKVERFKYKMLDLKEKLEKQIPKLSSA